jgi:hypothetical protein
VRHSRKLTKIKVERGWKPYSNQKTMPRPHRRLNFFNTIDPTILKLARERERERESEKPISSLIPKEKEAVIVYKDSMIQMYQERAKLDAMSRGFKTVSYLKKIEERKIEEKNVIVLLWRPPIS